MTKTKTATEVAQKEEIFKGLKAEFDRVQAQKTAAQWTSQSTWLPGGAAPPTGTATPGLLWPNPTTAWPGITFIPTPNQFPLQFPQWVPGTTSVSSNEEAVQPEPERITRAHLIESLRVGGAIVGGALGVFLGIPGAVALATPIHFGVAALVTYAGVGLGVVAFLVGDFIVARQNEFYTDVLARMTSPAKRRKK